MITCECRLHLNYVELKWLTKCLEEKSLFHCELLIFEDNKSLSFMTPLVFKHNIQNPLFLDGISLHIKANREQRHMSQTV